MGNQRATWADKSERPLGGCSSGMAAGDAPSRVHPHCGACPGPGEDKKAVSEWPGAVVCGDSRGAARDLCRQRGDPCVSLLLWFLIFSILWGFSPWTGAPTALPSYQGSLGWGGHHLTEKENLQVFKTRAAFCFWCHRAQQESESCPERCATLSVCKHLPGWVLEVCVCKARGS